MACSRGYYSLNSNLTSGTLLMGAGQGAVITTKERNFRIPAFPARVEDCTGAGDAYSAGFLVEYLRTKDTYKSGLFAAATASLVIEGSGGVLLERMPISSQVRRRISRGVSE